MKYFAYCRKSSEDEYRQVLSISSQQRELERLVAANSDIQIVEVFGEERSAMKPGRAIFGEMIRRIQKGEAEGIVAWAPDRLARNSIDGGQIVHLLDTGALRDMKFSTYTFENNSQGKFMLSIMFGQSKYYSDALSENVRRGVRTKLENGWWPTIAPLGYKNDAETRTIVPDPDRFLLIKEMLETMLTGTYSVEQIWNLSRDRGLKTPIRRRSGGRPLALSTVYKTLYNPFYAGMMDWNGTWYPGKHDPMITLTQFDQIQAILGRPGRPQPKKNSFTYTGLMTCGSCGLMITAENKTNAFGTKYVYYHCTKRLRPRCGERSVEVRNLEAQIMARLQEIAIPDALHIRTQQQITRERANVEKSEAVQRRSIEKALREEELRGMELVDMRSRRLIDDTEFLAKREASHRQVLRLRQSLIDHDRNSAHWFELAEMIISFSNRAVSWFKEGTEEEKRLIVTAVGSNFSLKARILSIQARKLFRHSPQSVEFPKLRAFVRDIRKMGHQSDTTQVITILTKLAHLRQTRLALPAASSPHSGGVGRGCDTGSADEKPHARPRHTRSARRTLLRRGA